ncbi:hypothetical protein A3H03_02475 [Candidatus Kuenenbacteria bacterium RIFCSPLOWO2_12_FULL_42_13]|uniref:Uncharacterized protein n=2 Tax=Candidatus Kueneniibacteriota TaxID=1752740 RepID=A0A1F6G2C9_9BACT|nr:MAG: hypothetical protein A3C68_00430 [Candidatus Kuenenbacteria bacterium RIFCSPHIGHO2_02_FULL_42_29]OGG91184.1 MAG: hypothetical protein A3H55_03495 [Candidatus Kuenenbacteria bacterium RIFCSPLOWO2_02_FULL_42_16]OGG92234.1 MAG: hypothetical protein A3H03_02475 [Candidatus Kuenenbacteria bacterium RIFCSPLOWO2_12_FULL_42_13]
MKTRKQESANNKKQLTINKKQGKRKKAGIRNLAIKKLRKWSSGRHGAAVIVPLGGTIQKKQKKN